MLEEACHWEWSLGFKKPTPFPAWEKQKQRRKLSTLSHDGHGLALRNDKPQTLTSISCLWLGALSQQ